MTPPLPSHAWEIFELVSDPRLLRTKKGQDPPYWVPRGGVVSDKPPTPEDMKQGRLQSSARLVAVRYRIEAETAIEFDVADDGYEPHVMKGTGTNDD
jgi:hypothetical protein